LNAFQTDSANAAVFVTAPAWVRIPETLRRPVRFCPEALPAMIWRSSSAPWARPRSPEITSSRPGWERSKAWRLMSTWPARRFSVQPLLELLGVHADRAGSLPDPQRRQLARGDLAVHGGAAHAELVRDLGNRQKWCLMRLGSRAHLLSLYALTRRFRPARCHLRCHPPDRLEPQQSESPALAGLSTVGPPGFEPGTAGL